MNFKTRYCLDWMLLNLTLESQYNTIISQLLEKIYPYNLFPLSGG